MIKHEYIALCKCILVKLNVISNFVFTFSIYEIIVISI